MDHILQNTDYKVFGLKRMNSSLKNVQHALNKIHLIDGDLLDETSLINALNIAKPDQIYHLGALSWVTPFLEYACRLYANKCNWNHKSF